MPKKINTGMENFSDHFDGFPFTHEQAFNIKNILERKFDPESVEKFIHDVRDCCEGATCLLDQQDFKTYKNDRKSMMALLEKSRDLLDTIREGRGLSHLSTFSKLLDEERSGLELECQTLATITGDLLLMLIRKIKHFDDSNERRLKGRPSADSKGIVAEIAKRWETCFNKKPTKYFDGPFAQVVQIVLEGLNLQYEYPQRKIHEALNK